MPNCHVRKGPNTVSLRLSSGTLLQYLNQDVETNIGQFPIKSISVEDQYHMVITNGKNQTRTGKNLPVWCITV